jgi:hypothetical protein
MKLVTFLDAMPPHGAGDTRLVPDDVADRQEAEGKLAASVAWPAKAAAVSVPRKPRRVVPVIERPIGVPDSRVAR